MVDLDPDGALYAKGLSAFDNSTALGNQNVILPDGTAKIGPMITTVRHNFFVPTSSRTLNDSPFEA